MKDKMIFMMFFFTICIFANEVYADKETIVFNTQDFAPFSYIVGNTVSGPGSDIIRAVCNEMNISCKFNLLPWRRSQKEVEMGQAHALFVIGWNKKREKWLYFSHPIIKTEYGIFVRNDNPIVYKNPNDIKGYIVGVYGPSNTSRSLEKVKDVVKDIVIDLKSNDETGFKKLSVGRVDAVYSNREVGFALMTKLNLHNIRYAGPSENLYYYIGFSKKFANKALVDKFNDTFKNLHQKGVINQILSNYKMYPAQLK